MNILYITHYSGLYGANKSLLELILNLRVNYKITPIVITPNKGEFNMILDENHIENYYFKFYPYMDKKDDNPIKRKIKFIRYKIYNNICLKKYEYTFKDKNISMVHTNSSVCDIGVKISQILKVKHIWHIREFGEEDYNLISYKSINKSINYIELNSDKVIFISKAIKEKYHNYFLNKNKFQVIYNGVNLNDYFIDINNKKFDKEFNIIFTGRISKEKNQMELLKAINLLVNEKKFTDIKVYILGDGDNEYFDKLKNYINEKKLYNNVFLQGKVNNVKEYIKKAQVGVISSVKEAFGRVTIEYMLGGIGVIASNTGANVELITNNINGTLYDLGNFENLAEKISTLYLDRNKLKVISFNGQKNAMNKFISDINTKEIYKVYYQVINNNL